MEEGPPARESIPNSLLEYDQWICWREADRDGKSTKVPIDPVTGEFASTTDPESWSSFETASERMQADELAGVGFVFTDDDPFVGVDLDDCRVPTTGTVADWASDVIDRLDSFTEVSPSGTGYHVLVQGAIPGDRNRKDDLELYETARYFTVTGDHVESTPTAIMDRPDELAAVHADYVADDQTDPAAAVPERPDHGAECRLPDEELIQKAKTAANGEKFERLWNGSIAGYDSHSEADMALSSLLAFWTGGDAHRIDRLFRESGLMRDKWLEPHYADGTTYGQKTIERAIDGTSEFYDPAGGRAREAQRDPEVAIDLDGIRKREASRAERIRDLEQRISRLLDEKAALEAELERERERRRELEDKTAKESREWRSMLDLF